MKPTALVTANVRFRNSDNGMIGSWTRASTNTKPAIAITLITISVMICDEFHAHVLPPRLVKRTTAESPPASSPAPR
jgi:hypothetical protein